MYDNLATLPLRVFTLAVGPAVDPASQGEAERRHGTAARVYRVTLSYALDRVETGAAQQTLYWTLARSDGRVVLVSDVDLADAGGASWRGPWDFGPLDVVRGAASVVLVHPQDSELGQLLADGVDAAVQGVTAVVGTGWSRRVVVLVPATAAERDALIGGAARGTSGLAAAAVSESGGGGLTVAPRLVVDPDQLRRLTPDGREVLLRHEVTHLAEGARETESVPRWLAEGFADYVGYLDTTRPVPDVARELAARLRDGAVPRSLPSDAEFDAAATGASSYQLAWLACRYLAGRGGQAALVRFYAEVDRDTEQPDQAVTTALRSVFGLSPAAFVAGWRAYVAAQFR